MTAWDMIIPICIIRPRATASNATRGFVSIPRGLFRLALLSLDEVHRSILIHHPRLLLAGSERAFLAGGRFGKGLPCCRAVRNGCPLLPGGYKRGSLAAGQGVFLAMSEAKGDLFEPRPSKRAHSLNAPQQRARFLNRPPYRDMLLRIPCGKGHISLSALPTEAYCSELSGGKRSAF